MNTLHRIWQGFLFTFCVTVLTCIGCVVVKLTYWFLNEPQ